MSHLKEYATGTDLNQGLGSYFAFDANRRKHSSLDRQTPAEVYRSGGSKRVEFSITRDILDRLVGGGIGMTPPAKVVTASG